MLKKYEIIKISEDEYKQAEDTVICEYPLALYVDGVETARFLCSPGSLKELVIGYLYSSSYIDSVDDIESLSIELEKGNALVELKNKDVVKSKVFDGELIMHNKTLNAPKFNRSDVVRLVSDFNNRSVLFNQTGGAHSCALANNDGIVYFEEDIARHNAVDKIIGKALLEKAEFKDSIIIASCRIGLSIIKKIAKAEIPVIISSAAPSSLAVDLARRLNITLIGFARGDRLNIYTELPSEEF